MSLNIGSGLLSAHISRERLQAIANNITPPEMSLWERIKDFFFSTHQKEALEYIYTLYHHANIQISAEEVHHAFTRLRELASPGCKEQFSNSYGCDLYGEIQYTILGKSGEALLSVTVHSEESLQRTVAPLTPSEYSRIGPPKYPLFNLAAEIQKLYLTKAQNDLSHIDRIIVFGDSLSDSQGRMFKKTHNILPSYHQYYEGRFTNGFTWSEYLSSPAFLKKPIINFAEGGSTSASYSPFNLCGDFLSNLDTQLDTAHAYIEHGYIHIPGEKEPELNISPQYLFNDNVHPTQEVHHAFASLLSHFIVHNY